MRLCRPLWRKEVDFDRVAGSIHSDTAGKIKQCQHIMKKTCRPPVWIGIVTFLMLLRKVGYQITLLAGNIIYHCKKKKIIFLFQREIIYEVHSVCVNTITNNTDNWAIYWSLLGWEVRVNLRIQQVEIQCLAQRCIKMCPLVPTVSWLFLFHVFFCTDCVY